MILKLNSMYLIELVINIYVFIASYYRQLFADIKMKKIKIKTSFFSPEGPKARAKKTGIDFMIFILIFVVICL